MNAPSMLSMLLGVSTQPGTGTGTTTSAATQATQARQPKKRRVSPLGWDSDPETMLDQLHRHRVENNTRTAADKQAAIVAVLREHSDYWMTAHQISKLANCRHHCADRHLSTLALQGFVERVKYNHTLAPLMQKPCNHVPRYYRALGPLLDGTPLPPPIIVGAGRDYAKNPLTQEERDALSRKVRSGAQERRTRTRAAVTEAVAAAGSGWVTVQHVAGVTGMNDMTVRTHLRALLVTGAVIKRLAADVAGTGSIKGRPGRPDCPVYTLAANCEGKHQ